MTFLKNSFEIITFFEKWDINIFLHLIYLGSLDTLHLFYFKQMSLNDTELVQQPQAHVTYSHRVYLLGFAGPLFFQVMQAPWLINKPSLRLWEIFKLQHTDR